MGRGGVGTGGVGDGRGGVGTGGGGTGIGGGGGSSVNVTVIGSIGFSRRIGGVLWVCV